MSKHPEKRRVPSDQKFRDEIESERTRNVVIDAGAGTGKTTLLVRRLVRLAAPTDDALPEIRLGRMAAVTFTRRAAGELRLRIRERLLEELAQSTVSATRSARLRAAVADLDTAYVGTIHSFADRLLRLQPMAARISPSYDVVDDADELVDETAQILLEAVQARRLAEVLGAAEGIKPEQVANAEETILDALTAGLHFETKEFDFASKYGLEDLVRGLINHRDREAKLVGGPKQAPTLDGALVDEFTKLTKGIANDAPLSARLKRTAARLRELRSETDAATLLREVTRALPPMKRSDGREWTLSIDCDKDKVAWEAWKALSGKGSQVRATPLRTDLLNPLRRWLAFRLARLGPVVVALYDQVKARHQTVDQVDLLLTLRRLMRDNLEARRFYQERFDHVFVDEFQDTDPLQAEILLYLCENGARAKSWDKVVPAAGRITIVGDPKQSIYRFRRADIGMYDRARRLLLEQPDPPLARTLSANFRSERGLIEWFNDRFERVLKPAPPGQLFDAEQGTVFHQALEPDTSAPVERRVRVLDLTPPPDPKPADADWRLIEAEAVAHYLYNLVERERFTIRDPNSNERRPVTYGDVAVLAIASTNLWMLKAQLDRLGIPHSTRGGSTFLKDELHRQFLLGLRALADRDDGVAEAALLRPPFFALDLVDVVRERATRGQDQVGEEAQRARAARALVQDLRARRFERSPGATARDLLERTAVARDVALSANGAQRLEHLRYLCLLLEQRAADEGLDYDGATARLRAWVDSPAKIEPPIPVGMDAVQVMTVHQAKGLEFPVVVLWDGRAKWSAGGGAGAWLVGDDPKSWSITLDGLEWEEPASANLDVREQRYHTAERRRLVYVAATRARDLLIVPNASPQKDTLVFNAFLEDENPGHVEHVPAYTLGSGAKWSKGITPARAPAIKFDGKLEKAVATEWTPAVNSATQPRFSPMSVSTAAHAEPPLVADEDEPEARMRPHKESRFGPTFGDTVHQAIGLIVRDHALAPADAVRRVAAETGLAEHLDEAAADVGRAIEALRAAGLLRAPGPGLRLEYPIAGAAPGGTLLSGFIDLVAVTDAAVDVIDFKTDQPPPAGTPPYEPYAKQVQAYGDLLRAAGVAGTRKVRCGLLYTADGTVRWV
jgi:ATP-dependent helicase/nuclease subunit A